MVVIMKTYPEYKEHWENCCVEDLDHVETDVQCIICLSLEIVDKAASIPNKSTNFMIEMII